VLLFLDLHPPSKSHDRGAARFVGRHAAANVVLGEHGQVG